MQLIEAGRTAHLTSEPMLTSEGVLFTVMIELTPHQCVVTRDALAQLAREHGFSMNPINTYRAFEAKINSVARSQLFRRKGHSSLVLEAGFFH